MFNSYGENYHPVFQNMAVDILTEQTTNFTAYQFFNERALIKDKFEEVNKFIKLFRL